MSRRWTAGLCLLSLTSSTAISSNEAAAAEPAVVKIWPGRPPSETKEFPPEQDINKPTDPLVGGRKIIKLTNVAIPTLSVYPAKEPDTRPAIIVCPGGGHHILAFDHEGTEVAEWLNTIGVTAFVLKYRVPFRNADKRWESAVQDAQRTVSLVRSKATEWKVDPKRIGILGFSAGGQTAGLTALLHEARQYQDVDAVDEISCRPDFAVLIYAGGFDDRATPWKLRDDIKVDSTTPPMFFAHSADDQVPVSNSVLLFAELRKANVAAEMHIYASGGHGYGIRKTGHPCNAWPDRCAEWMRDAGWIGDKPVRVLREAGAESTRSPAAGT